MGAQLGILAAAVAIAFASGWRVEAWRNDAAQLKAQQAATAKFRRDEKLVDVAAAGHEEFKAKEEIRYVEIEKKVRVYVDRAVYRNVCIDDDGVRLINDAIAGRADTGEPAATVPGSAASARR